MVKVYNTSEVRMSFNTTAAAEAGTTGDDLFINVGSSVYEYDAGGTDLTTGDGRTWTLATSGGGAFIPLAGGDMTGDLTRDGANIGLPEITTANTSRAFALTDVGNLVTVDTTAGAVVLTVNPNATTALPIVSIIHIALTDSTSSLTITAGAGVTINGITAGSAIVTSTDGSEVSLMKIATDEWLAVGNIGVFS